MKKNNVSPKVLLFSILGTALAVGVLVKFPFTQETVVEESSLFCRNENDIFFCFDDKLKPFSGTAIAKYKNGYISEQAHYKNGKLDGEMKLYYENGRLKEENNYEDGVQSGKARSYYDNGQLEAEVFVKDGKVNGVFKMYYKNGQLHQEGAFKNDERDGVNREYDETGSLLEETVYKDGEIVSLKNYREDE